MYINIYTYVVYIIDIFTNKHNIFLSKYYEWKTIYVYLPIRNKDLIYFKRCSSLFSEKLIYKRPTKISYYCISFRISKFLIHVTLFIKKLFLSKSCY